MKAIAEVKDSQSQWTEIYAVESAATAADEIEQMVQSYNLTRPGRTPKLYFVRIVSIEHK